MRVAAYVALAVMLGCAGPVLAQDIVVKTLTPHQQADVPLTTPPNWNEDESPADPPLESPADPTEESPADPTEEGEGRLVVPPEGMEKGITAEGDGAEANKEKFFLKSFRTLSNTYVVLATSTVFSSCVWAINPALDCAGRRKKRSVILPSLEGIRYL